MRRKDQTRRMSYKKSVLLPWELYIQLTADQSRPEEDKKKLSGEHHHLKPIIKTDKDGQVSVTKFDKNVRKDLLKNKSLTADLKMKVFDQMLAHDRNVKRNRGKNNSTANGQQALAANHESDDLNQSSMNNMIIAKFSRGKQPFVRSILENYIGNELNNVALNLDYDKLELILNGERLKSSNIIEILKYLLKDGAKSVDEAPVGSYSVRDALLRAGVPSIWFNFPTENSDTIRKEEYAKGDTSDSIMAATGGEFDFPMRDNATSAPTAMPILNRFEDTDDGVISFNPQFQSMTTPPSTSTPRTSSTNNFRENVQRETMNEQEEESSGNDDKNATSAVADATSTTSPVAKRTRSRKSRKRRVRDPGSRSSAALLESQDDETGTRSETGAQPWITYSGNKTTSRQSRRKRQKDNPTWVFSSI